MVIAIAVLVVYLVVAQPRQSYAMSHNPFPAAAGMVTNMVTEVSARLVETVTPKKTIVDAGDVYQTITKGTIDLADSENSITNADAWKEMTDAQKSKVVDAIRKWMNDPEHAYSVIMIFAPWCAHCHSAMPKLSAAVEKDALPCLMVNAESVPVDALTGANAIIPEVPVEYFPLIICKSPQEVKSVRSPESACESVRALRDKAEAPAVANSIAAGYSSMGHEESEDPFQELF